MMQYVYPPPGRPPNADASRRNGGYIGSIDPSIVFPVTLPPLRRYTYYLTAVAAGDYAANDVISQSATNNIGLCVVLNDIGGLALPPPGALGNIVTIYKVAVQCNDNSLLNRLRLHFFNQMPLAAEVEMDDNAAFGIATAAGNAKYLGFIDLPAFAARGFGVFAQANQLREEFACMPINGLVGNTTPSPVPSNDLFMLPQTLDAEANEAANMVFQFDFYVG